MYFWLKQGAEKQLQDLKEQGLLGEIRVETHQNSCKKYLATYEEPLDPTADEPNIPSELLEKVTLKDRIYRGFRIEGVYRHNDAVLLVKSRVSMRSDMADDVIEREEWQEISASAPNVAALRAIYTMVRQDKLDPDENFEQHLPRVPQAKIEKEASA